MQKEDDVFTRNQKTATLERKGWIEEDVGIVIIKYNKIKMQKEM
jgi:hypothetical protein